MKVSRTSAKRTPPRKEGLEQEYQFDYAKSKPNRFAKQMAAGSVAVVLDPDVAKVFHDAQSVNAVLRALLATMPSTRPDSL